MARRRIHTGDESGFSLVEVVVAMGIATIVLLALISSSIFGLQATLKSRQNQQSADYLNLAVENARSLAFAGVTMKSSDVSGDPNIVSVSGVNSYDPGSGLEPIAASATGQISPHVVTASTSNGNYTTKRYVTVPPGAPSDPMTGQPAIRRLTVEVLWKTQGKSHTRRTSTILTLTRRGLPLPVYTWVYSGPVAMVNKVPIAVKNPGNAVSYGLVLTNLGARDSWSVTASTFGWSYYLDTDQDGLWSETSAEPQVNPANTGLIEPSGGPVRLVAYRVIGTTETPGTTTTEFTATSDALPDYSKKIVTKLTIQTGVVVAPTPSATPTPTPTVSAAACAAGTATGVTSSNAIPAATTQNAYTLTSLKLINNAAAGDSATLAQSTLSGANPTLPSTLCNWSTDLQTNQAGRFLAASGGAGSATAKLAEFRFQPGSSAQNDFRGAPVLTLWVQCLSGTPNITVALFSKSGSAAAVARGSGTLTTPGCTATGFTRYSVQINDMPTFSMGNTDGLLVRLTTPLDVRLGYGASTVPATFTVGLK